VVGIEAARNELKSNECRPKTFDDRKSVFGRAMNCFLGMKYSGKPEIHPNKKND